MIRFLNVIAGILIGIGNDSWLVRLVIPFVWGIVFCVYVSFSWRDRRAAYIAQAESLDHKLKWDMSPTQSFYFIEYMTASSTSLIFSILSGTIKSIFW